MSKVTLIFLGILMIFQGIAFNQDNEFSALNNHRIFFADINDPFENDEDPESEIPENGETESEEENAEKSDLKSRKVTELGFNLYFSYLDKPGKPHISSTTSVCSKIPTPPPEV